MAKKNKKHRPKKRNTRPKQAAPALKKRSKYPVLALIAGGVLVIAGAYFLYQGKKPPTRSPQLTQVKKENIRLRENRPILSPLRFKGNVRRAYAVARAIPEVLDRLYCYCRCRENFGHKNLLSCYADTHAST
jgi:membrane peptidoglycan carboxypeptidase